MSTQVELVRDSFFSLIFHLTPRLANVLLLILVGQLAGPSEAGVFTLAATYLIIFTAVMRGLDDLLVRQVSREPGEAVHYLAAFLLLRLILSFLSYGVLSFFVLVVFEYAADTTVTILALALSLTPDNLTYVAQAVLLGKRHFGTPAVIQASISVFRLIGGALALLLGKGLLHVAWIWCVGSLLGMTTLLLVTFKQTGWPKRDTWMRWDLLLRNRREVLAFLSITTLMTIEGQIDIVFLSAFHDESVVGWYGAATTIAFSLTLFSQAYQLSIYPLMTRYALQEPDRLSKLYERSIRYLGAAVLPMVAGVALLSPRVVVLIFGPEFGPTAKVLRILIFSLVFMFLNAPDSRMMLVHNCQGWIWLFMTATLAINVLSNLLLVPLWAASGAAMARLGSSAMFFLFSHLYVARSFVRLDMIRLLSKPIAATLAMTVTVWAMRTWPLPAIVGVGMIVYVGLLWRLGGVLPNDVASLCRKVVRRRIHPSSDDAD